MSFVTPIALAWAALTIPIVVFYILKVRLRQVPVSTAIFWQQIYDEKAPRSLWQQLRHWLSLLVQIVWLLLLVLALAEPFLASELRSARRTILVIDNSASMNARDVLPTRLDAARRAARAHAATLRFRDEMAVIAAGTQPQVVCGLTGHERTLQRAIDSVAPTEGPSRVAEAVALARRLLADAPHGEIIVFSDGGFPESEKLAGDDHVKLHGIGTQAANVGITRFQVRRSQLDPIGYEILIEVQNAAVELTERRLELELNGIPVDVVPLKLAAGQVWSQTFEKTSVDGGTLTARLTGEDALAADDMAQAILPRREMQRVLLISPGNLFLEKALAANPLVELQTTRTLPEAYEPGVIHVFHRLVPSQLPEGQSLVVEPLAGCDLWSVGAPLENPIVTQQQADSPLMQHVRLDNVLLPQARQLTPAEGIQPQVLVGAVSGDPLYLALRSPPRQVLVLTVNLDQGDLTFRTAFPILVTNALGWFAGHAGSLREALETGAVHELTLPESAASRELVLRAPDGATRPLPATSGKLSIGPLDRVGIWSIVPAGDEGANEPTEPLEQVACNLASRTESDLRPPEAWRTAASPELAAGLGLVRPLWFYLVALALVVAAVEWFLYQRRWIG